MAADTTTTLSNEMMTYYSSRFLERDKDINIHGEGFQKSVHGKYSGKTIRFNRYAPLSRATTPLTEASNPPEDNFSTSTVDVTLAEYGKTVRISKLLSLTSIDKNAAEKISNLGQNMSDTIDRLNREEMYAGATVKLANGRASLSLIVDGDNLTALEVRKVVRDLKKAKAMTYPDGMFLGKIGPDTEFDLMGDATWQNAKIYSDVKDLYRGEIGSLHKVRFLTVTDQKSETGAGTTTGDAYSNFFHGANAVGKYDLEGDMPKLYIKTPNSHDTSNPADRYSTISWAGSYAVKTLIPNWIINLKTAASA